MEALARQFVAAWATGDEDALRRTLSQDAGLRWWGEAVESHHPAGRVVTRLLAEASAWSDPVAEVARVSVAPSVTTVEFVIRAGAGGQVMALNRCAVLEVEQERIRRIDLYAARPVPSAYRMEMPLRPRGDSDVERWFRDVNVSRDLRRDFPEGWAGYRSREIGWSALGDPHPGTNSFYGANFPEDEADERIAAILAEYRERGHGLQWFVGPGTRPADLGARLERHGFMLAGDQSYMARVGLDPADIPPSAHVELRKIGPDDDEGLETALQVTGAAFEWPPEQVGAERPSWFAMHRLPWHQSWLAFVEGRAVGTAQLIDRLGVAYLGGAGTLPEARGRHVYTSLLRARLQDAHERGYEVAAIDAEPMSRRVVKKYGFREYGMTYIYGWMPVMDEDVIRSLVQDH